MLTLYRLIPVTAGTISLGEGCRRRCCLPTGLLLEGRCASAARLPFSNG